MAGTMLHLEADLSHFADKYAGVCRRGARRFHFSLSAVGWLTVDDESSAQEVWLANISETGIGFYSDWPLERDSVIVMRLTGQGENLVLLTAQVVHSTKRETGNWLVGCAFTSRLAPETLEDLL